MDATLGFGIQVASRGEPVLCLNFSAGDGVRCEGNASLGLRSAVWNVGVADLL
jgi:hypothetical protein